MRARADVWYQTKRGKEGLEERYNRQRSRLLVTMGLNTVNGGRLSGLWMAQSSFGWWVPVAVDDEPTARTLAAWWNATPARLMLLNRRDETLTYPTRQVAHRREIRIPKPDSPAWAALEEAFYLVCDEELLPMRQAEECAVRDTIDQAAALALDTEPAILADWRRRLAAEPTVSNERVQVSSEAE